MSLIASILLATELLAVAPEAPAEAVVGTNDVAQVEQPEPPRSVTVTSDRSQYLRNDGVLAFDGNVFVDDVEFKLHADEVTIFLQGTNELKRVVAIGNVCMTNELRTGTCVSATYNKQNSKVIMYGDKLKNIKAILTDNGKRKSEVQGWRITFWVDTEQVVVDGSTVTVDAADAGGKDGARKALGL